MPARPFQTNFTAGEVSRQLDARMDYARYKNGAELIKNGIVRTTGGVNRRAGTYFVHEAADTSKLAVLVPFVFSIDQAYALEFQAGTIRFYQNRAILLGQGDGSEKVTNGTFPANLAGWTITNTGTGTTIWNALTTARLNAGAAGTTRISQAITTVAGTAYILEFTVTLKAFTMQLGTSDGAVDVLAAASYAIGHHKIKVTATGTTTWVQFLTAENADHDLDTVKFQIAAPLTVTTSYAEADLRDLRFEQIADVLYIWHRNYAPAKLLRLGAIEWELRTVSYQPPPSGVIKRYPNATLTPGATTGAGVTFTLDTAYWLSISETAKIIQSGAGRAAITGFTDTTHVTADIIDDFSSTDPIAAGNWSLLGSPYSLLGVGAVKEPVGLVITLTTVDDCWRSSDVGSYVTANGGLMKVTKYTDTKHVQAQLKRVMTVATNVVAGAWTLEDPVWSASLGYPEVGCFHEQRLVAARDDTIWGSGPSDFESYGLGSGDDDAYEYTIGSTQAQRTRWMVSAKSLLLGMLAQESTVRGVTDGPISPGTPPNIVADTAFGSDFSCAAVRVGKAALFPQRGGRVIRELAYTFESDGFVATDLSIVAEHLFRSNVLQLARMTTPQSLIFAVRADGVLLACTYERPENVVAWTRLVTGPGQDLEDGMFESVCVIPNNCGTGDEVWVAVRRWINGVQKRYIEVFDGSILVDSGLVYSGDPVDVLSGLSHLTGEVVQVVADGVFSTALVAGGSITLDAPASTIMVGLGYTTRIKTLRSEVETAEGTSQFRDKHSNRVFVRFYCTGPGVTINGQTFTPKGLDLVEDSDTINLGWDRADQVTVEQTQPFAVTVLGIGRALSVGDA